MSLIVLLCATVAAPAQLFDAQPKEEFPASEQIWFSPELQRVSASVQLLGGNPLTTIASRQAILQTRRAPPLNQTWLRSIKDDTGLADVDNLKPAQYPPSFKAYCQAIVLAAKTSASAFTRSTLGKKSPSFKELFTNPNGYRGEIIRVEGRLRNLRRIRVPDVLKTLGIKTLYDAWIFTDGGTHTYRVIFPIPPLDLKVGPHDTPVTFRGYFLKRYKLQTDDGERILPLVIARSVDLRQEIQQAVPFKGSEKFWFSPQRGQAAAATEMVAIGNPLAIAVMRVYGRSQLVWNEEEFIGGSVQELNPKWLKQVTDNTGLPDVRNIDFREYPAEFKVYCQAVEFAKDTPIELFKEAAKENSHISFAHMYREPDKYRGKVVSVTGRLARLRKYEAPAYIRRLGILFLYVGLIFTKTRGSHPVCVIATEIPKAMKVGESVRYPVKFYGYFLKRFRYIADKGALDTPLVIGPKIFLTEKPVESSGPGLSDLLIYLGGFLAVLAVLMLVVSIIYRRSDDKIRKQISDIQTARGSQQFEDLDEQAEGSDSFLDSSRFPDSDLGSMDRDRLN